MDLRAQLAERFSPDDWGVFVSNEGGYWSNLDRGENQALVDALRVKSTREAIRESHPRLEPVIYSPKRAGGLELLRLRGDEICVDLGCMWGALTIPLAKRSAAVIGVDQTLESLRFLAARAREEGLTNVNLIRHDIRTLEPLPVAPDVAVVNGVLEWVAEEGALELKSYFQKRQTRAYSVPPDERQRHFLKRVHGLLKPGGRLYLAIENRYDFTMFVGGRDPHIGLPFTAIMPRWAADLTCRLVLGRPYVTWIYSFGELRRLLQQAGFGRVDMHMCFPDYRFPERIIPYEQPLCDYALTIAPRNAAGRVTLKRRAARVLEHITFRKLKAKSLSPSIIAVAHK